MLILTRRIGETIVINDDISVTVLGVKGCQVRIGVDAPKTTPVHRKEIYEKIKAEVEKPTKPIKPTLSISPVSNRYEKILNLKDKFEVKR